MKHDKLRSGAIGELAFALQATQQGLNVSQPLLHSHVYDFVVDGGASFVRVQVKAAQKIKRGKTERYSFAITPAIGLYKAKDVHVFALYAAECATWYFVPFKEVVGMSRVSITVGREGRFGKYKNRWDLLRSKEV